MTLPLFDPGNDPGPDFAELLRRTASAAPAVDVSAFAAQIPHGTTVLAARYGDGVVMAGDRRATSGNLISHATIEKVFPADHYSGVAIAGAAGPAVEMVRLFQLQLEHYEKVEGATLSLEGKANQLSQLVRANLPAAMQGLAVVPIFSGYDTRRRRGRLFAYDVTGGRYEEHEVTASGSGMLHASTVLKLSWHEGMRRDEVVDLVLQALMTAAEEDSATGGPDPRRGIFPIVATISADGFVRLDDTELSERVARLQADTDRRRGRTSTGDTP